MIINKLMTLSQFVDWCDGEYVDLNKYEDIFEEYYVAYEEIINYNNYLKQLLTKDMFINEIEKPLHIFSDDPDENKSKMYQKSKDVIKWKEAESKVIFKGEKIVHNEDTIEFKHSDNVSVYYYHKEKDYGIFVFGSGFLDEFRTLSDLAESTNGELQIHLEL